jgi:hypothetical protein
LKCQYKSHSRRPPIRDANVGNIMRCRLWKYLFQYGLSTKIHQLEMPSKRIMSWPWSVDLAAFCLMFCSLAYFWWLLLRAA